MYGTVKDTVQVQHLLRAKQNNGCQQTFKRQFYDGRLCKFIELKYRYNVDNVILFSTFGLYVRNTIQYRV